MSVLLRRYYQLLAGFQWLTAATKQAILGAFRNDGPAVIGATNEYLNGIAASDNAKATALAALINEDPMMVCSLGLEPQGVTMPVRWIDNNATAWIQTNYTINTNTVLDLDLIIASQSGAWAPICGSGDSWNTSDAFHLARRAASYDAFAFYCGGNYDNTTISSTIGDRYKLVMSKNKLEAYNLDRGTSQSATIGTTSIASSQTFKLRLFKSDTNYANFNTIGGDMKFRYFKVIENNNEVLHFIPCHDKTQGNGMLDLVNVVFYPNAGTGQFTIPDISYTPTP